MNSTPIDWKKYLLAFLITAMIFGTAFYLSSFFSQKKIDEIRSIQDKISLQILSSETQFSLLEEFSCKALGNSPLSQELNSLGDKLSYTEQNQGASADEVNDLKTYYSLLQIKDYLLMKKASEKCKLKPIFAFYFYSNKGDCPDCQKEGYVLTKLREDYPDFRVYSFDYNLDTPAIKTLISVNKIKNKLPALLLNDDLYYGFQSITDIEKNVPSLKLLADLRNASSTAATTATSSKK